GFFFAAWMSIDIVVLILGLDTESSVFAVPFVAGFLVTFVIGLFVPDRFYKRYLAFFYHLITFIRVRIVELLAYHELTLEHRHSSIAWRDVLQSPEHATYKSVIAVLDSSKLLCAQPEKTLAWSLGHEISSGCSDTSNYLEVVNHLREIGGECLFSRGALKAFSHLFLIQIGQSTLSHAGE
ncbi:MAG: hypothetical protein JXB07_19775, partial [Anaerolineae bacterium]|nr:hypothetical protein [Anaerolineae bacterium]